ncbi:DUF4097 family beta strand repeat-containing protein [Kitasatospora kifunensis]|uniref:DUF4097 and DUF4098 domain-containing protein YvlB n=1 Tax=Kitasatospora kifunensis TaxID=58351 RepID=A0A7W7VX26_KITKI|nr:DUF4097 family beta strand repeat-containing protein [Kitasatospora kifunensis]MBB4925185.1 DUF4097 and DUF4098 domain-containing protein YvlB [Kitasatospora kifunensis]
MNQRLTRMLGYTAITGLVVFGMSGCFFSEQQHSDVSYGIDQPVHSLVIQGKTGGIRVVGAGTGVHVVEHQSYDSKAPASTHTVADGTLTLTYTCDDDCGINYEVDVPAGTDVKVSAGTGDVHLSGLSAGVQATTGTGQVEGVGLAGASADLRSSTGDVSATFTVVPGSVTATTSTGNVKVVVPSGGYAVKATADTGTVKVTVPQDAASGHAIDAESDTGNVTVSHA